MAAGYQLVTTDTAVSGAGIAVTVYGIHLINGGGAGTVILRSGSSTGGTAIISHKGTAASVGNTFNYPGGITFPSGCFVDVDASVSSVAVIYEKV